MNENIISQLGKDQACKPSLIALRKMSIDEMLKHYILNIDFGICSELLGDDFFLKNSTKQQRNAVGIHVNETFSKGNPSIFVMIGKCDIGTVCNGFNVGQLFIRDESLCNLNACDNSVTIVECFGDAKLNIMQRNDANVIVNVYGNSIVDILSAEKNENIKINIKHKDKY